MVYCMGDEADNALRSLDLTGAQHQRCNAVKLVFNRFFVPRKNVIYERAKLNKRVQQPAEPVDAFITQSQCMRSLKMSTNCFWVKQPPGRVHVCRH
uniref:Uncharacterized protein n=1 Tax=Nothobranchius furzeri TaxID=105023 RepID=A0A8C6LGR2_NOTFU